MFERFTDRARRVVVLAQEEARGLNHNYIGTEHILLALLREGEGVAARSWTVSGSRWPARGRKSRPGSAGQPGPPKGKIPFTPRAKKVLELSLREALPAPNYIGTEHILLGLVREGDGVAAQILAEHAGDLTVVRAGCARRPAGGEALQGRAGCAGATCPCSPASPARPGEPEPGGPGMPTTPAADAGLAEAARLAGTSRSAPTTCCSRRWPTRTAPRPGP